MTHRLNVHLLPDLVAADELRGQVVAVVDLLRATTTITWALANGAREVVPCLEVEEARELASRFAPGQCLLGGERQGLPIPGFDLGNSPREYQGAGIADKTIVFTTTNGTRALAQCHQARLVVLGALVNLSAVAQALAPHPQVHLLCAGTRGRITREDALAAGAIAERLLSQSAQTCELNDEARIALDAWRAIAARGATASTESGLPDTERLVAELEATQGGRNLADIGLAGDIRDAAAIDRFSLVGRLDPVAWKVLRE